MIKVLTSTKEEYEVMKKLIDGQGSGHYIHLYRPEDSVASVVWSTEDVKDCFPEGTPEDVVYRGLLSLEKALNEGMTSTGWDIIDVLEDDLLKVLEEDKY